MKGLGSFLREIREEKNLTLTDVYKKTGITDSRLSRIETESGKYSPPIADVIKLAELYNIDYDKILSFSTVYSIRHSLHDQAFFEYIIKRADATSTFSRKENTSHKLPMGSFFRFFEIHFRYKKITLPIFTSVF